MFSQPVSLAFIFATIGVILLVVALGIVAVNKKTKQIKEK